MPGTDLLLTNSFDELTATTIEAKHIGQGVIDGVECEHLATFVASIRTGRYGSRAAHVRSRENT